MTETKEQGLDYVKLDIVIARIMLLTNESFGNTKDFRSQLGYLILMVNDNGDCNLLHFVSNRCKRVARSVIAAELFALVLGFNKAYFVRDLVEELTGRLMSIDALIDSKKVFDVIANACRHREKRLQIDIRSLREN